MASAVAPVTVANSFVKQYYSTLCKKPEDVHRFYNQQSSFTYETGNETAKPSKGQKEIHETIESLNFKDATVDFEHEGFGSVDCQASINESVFILVTGIITRKGDGARKFVQSFLLALSEKNGQRSYYVHNAAFRLLDPEQKSTVVSTGVSTATGQTDEDVKTLLEGAVAVEENSKEASGSAPEPATDVASKESEQAVEEPAAEVVKAEEKPKKAAEAKQPVAKKPVIKSWGALGASLAADGGDSRWANASMKRPAPTKANAGKSGADAGKAGKGAKGGGRSTQIYLKPVGTVTEQQLTDTFKEFGTVTEVVFHRDRKYCFVSFADPASVDKVLANGKTITIDGLTIAVEKKNSQKPSGNASGNSSGGGRQRDRRGRGGRGGRDKVEKSKGDGRKRERGGRGGKN